MSPTLNHHHRYSDRTRGVLLVVAGVLILSFDALLVRLAQTDGWTVVFWRGTLIAVSLSICQALHGGWRGVFPRELRLPAFSLILLLGVNTVLFVQAISHTAVANTVVILASAPLFAAVFTHLFLHERVQARAWVAIVVVLLGVVIVFAGSIQGDGLWGDAFALLAAVVFGAAVTLLRRYQTLNVVPVIAISGLLSAIVAFPFAQPLGLTLQSYAVLAFMGLAQMPVAMVLLTLGPRYLPAPEVSLLLLLETVLGPIWVWYVLGERPPPTTLMGGGVILLTLIAYFRFGGFTLGREREQKTERGIE